MPATPNLLTTRTGRLTGFFCLYAAEGLPQGFEPDPGNRASG
jgi:hypothetical protein